MMAIEDTRTIGVLASSVVNRRIALFTMLDYRGRELGFNLRVASVSMWPSLLLRSGARHLDGLLSCGDSVKADVQNMGLAGQEIAVLRYPLTEDLIEKLEQPPPQGQSTGSTTALYVGPPRPERGCFELLRAFRSVLKECPELELNMVIRIDSPTDEHLLRILHSEIRSLGIDSHVAVWTGHMSKSELLSKARESTFAVLPYRYVPSSWPVSLLELLAVGVPVVTTSVGCVTDIADPGSVLMARPCDVEAIKQAMCRLATDAELRAQLVRRGREAIRRLLPRALAYHALEKAIDFGKRTEE